MIGLGFLNENNTPTEDVKKALPNDIRSPTPDIIDKTIILFHDETTYQVNDDQPTLWAEKDTSVICPKSKRSGIMISDFIDDIWH